MKVLGDPGVELGYIWQMKTSGEKKHGPYLWLGGSILEL
jgi:hypothetical protein